LANPLMRPRLIEIVSGKDRQHMSEVASPENDDVIETLTTNASKVALALCIHQRSQNCGSHHFHSGSCVWRWKCLV